MTARRPLPPAAPGPGVLPGTGVRARGAGSNLAGRFEATSREAADDGWDRDEEVRLLRTEVREERARSALSWNRSPDLPFDRSVNPYRAANTAASTALPGRPMPG